MSLTPDHPWYWIERNRQRRQRAVPVGPLAAGWLQSMHGRTVAASRILQALHDLVDAEFRAHCSLGPVSGGRLTILVDEVARVHAMRIKWLFPIRQRLLNALRDVRITRIDFQPGRSPQSFQIPSLIAGTVQAKEDRQHSVPFVHHAQREYRT